LATLAVRTNHLVGRRPQLQLLTERYGAAERGEGSIVIIAGEAGAGKTRLVSEFCRTVSDQGGRFTIGRCLEYIQVPYAPFISIIGAFATSYPNVMATAPQIVSVLAHLIPELHLGATPAVLPSDKLRQFNMIAEALRRFGSDRVAVAVIEDLHWADSGTLELLLHVASHIDTARVLLILTYRDEELPRDHPLRSALAKLERNHSVMRAELEPLDRAQMHTLLLHALGRRRSLPAHLISAICVRAEGNPLFAEELLKTILARPHDVTRQLPTTVQEAVRDRLRELSDAEQSTLAHAAALGRRFRAEFLAEMLGLTVDDIAPALKRAIELGLIGEQRNGDVYYSFKHELQRAAVYSELLGVKAQALHKKIALALEADKPDEHTVELAYHWWQAHDPAKSARFNERAGDNACGIFAYGDAVVNYERALEAGVAQGVARAELSLKLAHALSRSGYGERTKDVALSALADYEAAGDSDQVARACMRLAGLSARLDDITGTERFLERALELIENNVNNPTYFAAHIEMMFLHVAYHWNLEKARYHMAQADSFIGSPPSAAKIRYLQAKTAIEACSGRPREALAQTQAAARLAVQTSDVMSALHSWCNFGAGMTQIGEPELGLRGLEEGLKLIRDQHIAGLPADWVFIYLANALLHQGQLQRALEFVEQALNDGVELSSYRLAVAETGILLGLWLELDELVERCADAELIDAALQSGRAETVGATASFSEYYAMQGKHEDARRLAKRALDVLEGMSGRQPGEHDKFFVSVARIGDDVDIGRSRAYLERVVRDSKVRSAPACLALVEAYSLARQGDRRGGETKAKALEAASLFHDIGWPHYEAQALELAGNRNDALEIYRRMGDLRDTHRLEAEMAPPTRRGRAASELSMREREIMNLLVTGKSNKAIAAVLVLSERTVENHVSSILAKSGAISRAELIAKTKAEEL